MSSFEQAMVYEIKNSIAAFSDKKVFPLVAPADVLAPYIVYGSSEGIRIRTLDGHKTNKVVNVDLNILANDYGSLKQSASDVIALLIGFEGRTIGAEGLYIQQMDLDDDEPDEMYDEETRLFVCVISFAAHI